MAPSYFPYICHTFHSRGKISLQSCSRRSVNPRWPGSETCSCTVLLSVGNQRTWLFTITFWKRKVFSCTWSATTVVKLKTSVVINVESTVNKDDGEFIGLRCFIDAVASLIHWWPIIHIWCSLYIFYLHCARSLTQMIRSIRQGNVL